MRSRKLGNTNLTRRSALGLGAAAAAVTIGASFLGRGSAEVSNDEFTTLFVGDEEPECKEASDHVTRPELIAHIGCAIAMSAVGADDYDAILDRLGLHGSVPGKYTYSDGRFHPHNHDNAAWNATHTYQEEPNGHGDIFEYGIDEMPNPSLPNARAYIDFKLCKGVLPEYGEYMDPENGDIWIDADHGILKPEYIPNRNKLRKNFDGYAQFAMCGAIPAHIHQAVGLNPRPLWRYFCRTVSKACGGGGMTMAEALPSAVELDEYVIMPFDLTQDFRDFCRPGDLLAWCHDTGDGIYPRATHFALFVGNDIAQKYFPGTTGNVCEAGAGPDSFCGITEHGAKSTHALEWLFVCRPKDGEVNPRQDLPKLNLGGGCEEPCRLTLGERAAHCACGIAMTAIGERDYNADLRALGIYGSGVGLYTYSGGLIANTPGHDAAWLASQDPGKVERWVKNDGCACEFDHMAPDTRIPGAQKYIDFTMAKGVLPEYGVYIPEPLVREPEYAAQAAYNKAHISNHDGIPGYSRFCMCGTATQHVFWAIGADIEHAEDCHGQVRGHGVAGGVSSKGIPYVADSPSYCFYFPDHIYGKGSPMESEHWLCWSVDWERPWDEQCEPGDVLCIGPAWSDEMPADFVKHEHGQMYVGNEIVRMYFPNSDGIIAMAGGAGMLCGVFWGIVGHTGEMAEKGYRIYRPKNRDVEPRQWVPDIIGCPNE